MANWTKICCPIDFSETSRVALEEAAELSRRYEGELALLHVFEPPAATADLMVSPPDVLDQTAKELERKLDLWRSEAERRGARVVRTLVVTGAAATEVVRFARDGGYDLVVMGTHGRRGLRHLVLGSVAERVVREAPCAVLVVRPPSRV
ncbi:MAG TPA: universal stress protein [Anaeromyxobacteraceae bacterium]|nr:universal stress protein [Anaeromyxobacteraceae bacterium]